MGYATKPKGCEGCDAYEWGVGFVPPEGPPDAKICILGSGPSQEDAYSSSPFLAGSGAGGTFTKWIYSAHYQRGDILIGDIVQCWLPNPKTSGVMKLFKAVSDPTNILLSSCFKGRGYSN